MLRLSLAKRHLMKCGKKSENENSFLIKTFHSKQTFIKDFDLAKNSF